MLINYVDLQEKIEIKRTFRCFGLYLTFKYDMLKQMMDDHKSNRSKAN